MRYLIAALFVSTVFTANWALDTFGIIPIGFGLMAPAGVFFAGLGFLLRDLLHEVASRRWVVGAILIGAVASYWINPVFAVASGLAFLVSELADYGVYAPLRVRTLVGGMAASQVVGAAVDSALFLWLAFGSLQFFTGQFVGKVAMTVPALALILAYRAARVMRATEMRA
jgi:queuosine precursor transporter